MKICMVVLAAAATLCQGALAASTGQQAAHVVNRLSFGPRPGEIDQVAAMGVRRYIDSQLDPAAIALPPELTARLQALATVNRPAGAVLGDFIAVRQQARDETEASKAARRAVGERIARETAEARVLRALASPRELEEVMVDFWFNHFNVYAGKGVDRALIASYERDAIRPYAMGSFRDLLGATAMHPAMLYYLDNVQSSAASQKPNGKPTGLNENYARELMELHTLGVDAGYSQQDVTELARMLTGWTYDQRRLIADNETFRFDPRRHDNGVKTWLGRAVAPSGQREGEMALDVLAAHPATARHISYQLAQYFVQDAPPPPPALVEQMARSWQASHGDIRTVLRTLFYSEQFLAPAAVNAKFKTPYRYVLSAARAADTPVLNVQPLLSAMNQLGMPLYGCQTPDGYKNTEAAWLNPDALSRRIAFATGLAGGRLPLATVPAPTTPPPPDGAMMVAVAMPVLPDLPAALVAPVPLDATRLGATLGSTVSPRTHAIVSQAAAPLRAAVLLGSPDFMQY